MLHYKAFSSETTHGDMAALEEAINAWLAEIRPLVHTMTQSPCGSGALVSFLYELEDDEAESVSIATAEVEATRSIPQPALADSLMITLLPQMELPY